MARTSYTGPRYVLNDAALEQLARTLQIPGAARGVPAYQQEAVALWDKKGRDGDVILEAGKMRYVSADDDAPPSRLGGSLPFLPMQAGGTIPRSGPLPRAATPSRDTDDEDNDMDTSVNYCWAHTVTGTGTQSEAEVKPNDPLIIHTVEFDSDDATARLTSIKQGSEELLAYSGKGIRVSAFTRSGVARRLFKGRQVNRENPLKFVVVHADSGTNNTTCTLYGDPIRAACAR